MSEIAREGREGIAGPATNTKEGPASIAAVGAGPS
jgi:hypothetical protein